MFLFDKVSSRSNKLVMEWIILVFGGITLVYYFLIKFKV